MDFAKLIKPRTIFKLGPCQWSLSSSLFTTRRHVNGRNAWLAFVGAERGGRVAGRGPGEDDVHGGEAARLHGALEAPRGRHREAARLVDSPSRARAPTDRPTCSPTCDREEENQFSIAMIVRPRTHSSTFLLFCSLVS